ncbi:MAG: isoleucine--tRNA ligase [Lactobacillales bacterium]|jgi:isoleucyl-tRNA synthetase|nr:isoleucine--tRNA ligase [Lactobacillales bacterium]
MSEQMQKHYPELNAKLHFPEMEKDIIRIWEDGRIFEKSVENRRGADEFVFYDGPPFANGVPHYGHIMVSYVKDTVARFQTMNGKRVERRLGWDCHGLPAEMSAEKQLGVSGHKDIKKYGIKKFNDFCRTDVLKYANIWTDMFRRIGRWVDFSNDYKTMDLSFMESVIHNFKQLYDKGMVYEDYQVQPYSWAAQTMVSNFEVNQGYKEKVDDAITVLFKLENGLNMLVWTTTPWTLPSNLMLAVGADIDYAVMQEGDEKYVLAEALLGRYKKQLENATQVETVKGSDLVGKSYTPLFPYFENLKEKGCFKVLAGDFVSVEDGTGIVHIAPGFGQDDFNVCRAIDPNFPIVCPVDEGGLFTAEVTDYAGKQVFDTNDDIIGRLKNEKRLVKKEQVSHSYPYCWRTDKPLIYKAVSGWFVKVTDIAPEMVKLNEQITWTPDHLKTGRFGKWLEGARDWAISRNRFWGTPIPVWRSDNPEFPRIDVFGSIAEIKEKTGFDVTDLHRPMIDDVVYPNPDDASGKTMMRRVEDVFDCWFESGSMPEGQIHYPFENKEWFQSHFPADFIVEAIDQTRGWFYTLHVLGTALHHKPAYKNCLCTGLIMAEDGQKLSKRLKNYPDPNMILNTYGSDAMRWFFLSSPVIRGGNVLVDQEGKEVAKVSRKSLLPFYNAFYFFCLYANAEGIKAHLIDRSDDILDQYILSKLKVLTTTSQKGMDNYDINKTCADISAFLEILNNWYIRRSRARFWDGEDMNAFNTLYTVLVTLSQIAAPMMPMLCEFVYRSLTGGESVHLTDYPTLTTVRVDDKLIEQMDLVQSVSSVAKAIREENRLRNRLPLISMTIAGKKVTELEAFTDMLKDEVNVKSVIFNPDILALATPFLYLKTPLIGKRLGAYMKDIMAASKTEAWQQNPDRTLSIAGQTLQPDEYELRYVLKEGLHGMALPDNTAVVQLDTTVSPELEKEGIARDFVRMIQQARKEAGLDVSDRIDVVYRTESDMVKEALTSHDIYVKDQVLATSLAAGSADENTQELGDGTISFKINKS